MGRTFRFNSEWIKYMIVFDLCIKGITLDAISDDLLPTLVEEAANCSTVTNYARSVTFIPKEKGPSYKPAAVGPALSMRHIRGPC
jgi:hypothetical protein